ncbi:MAG: hypothetical protein AAF569_03050 [Pseudomonadota bacterium]
MKFSTYDDWKHCITELCDIPLTPDYIEKRIAELNDQNNHHTHKFIDVWGEPHLQKVIGWFEQARQEFKA